MFIILFTMCVRILQADIVTNTFHKDGDCGAASGAPAYVREVESRSRIHCFAQCSKISECNSVIYQSATKTCLLYGANKGTCPSTNGRVVDVYKKNAVVTNGSVSSDSPTTSYGTIGTTVQVVEETSYPSTISSVTTYDPSCVNGKHDTFNGRSQCICNDGFMGTTCQERFTSCTDWEDYLMNDGVLSTGKLVRQEVTIQPPNSPQPFTVQCDAGSIFTSAIIDTYIYINAKKVSNTFDQSWSQMKKGFDFDGGFWIGLDHLHELITNERRSMKNDKLIITFEESSTVDETGIKLILYDHQIGNETTNYKLQYKLTYGSYYGQSFSDLNDAMFSAKDKDNDGVSDSNCAFENKRAFWYKGECSFDELILTAIKIRKYFSQF